MSTYPDPYNVVAGVGSTTSAIVLGASASTVNGFYDGLCLEVRSGNGAGHGLRFVDSYNGATKTAILSEPITNAPVAGDQIRIAFNDNHFGFASGATTIKIIGGVLKNIDVEKLAPAITGGKGINFEQGVHDCLAIGTTIKNVPGAAFFVQGKDGVADNGSALKATGIRAGYYHAEDCGAVVAVGGINNGAAPDGDAADSYGVVSNITYERCGHAPQRIVGSNPQKSGIIGLLEAQNFTFNNIRGFNPGTYPDIAPGYPSGTKEVGSDLS